MLYALYKCIDVREIQKGKSMKRKKSTQLLAVALTAAMLAQPVGAQMVFAEGNADAVQQEQAVSPAAETTGAVLKSGTAVIPADADLNQVKEILGKTLFVLLTGGEPLLYPHFRELYQKLRELGMIITINTNGTLIDEAWADFFAENKPRRINITLYGASNETYERLCHYPGGFDKAVNGIRLLRERNIDVKVNGSLAKANVDDRMKIIELGESLDAPVRIDTYMYPSVRERNHAYNNQARLDPEMAAKARVEVLQKEMGEEVFAQYRKIQLDEAENTPEGEAVPGQMACRAGKSSFVVNWQGEMRSCVVLDKPSIPLRDVEFEEAWELTKKGTESLRISARCSSCKLRKVCNTCVAAAIAETGKADGVPEYLCRYTEATVRYLKETSKK